jgi:cation diffusion facilitator family transporter
MDVLALGASVMAMRLAVRRPTARFTFGMRRAEPVAAIFNGLLVLVATAIIVSEGVVELIEGASPKPGLMLIVASAALVVNGVSAWLLHDAIGHAGHVHGGDTDNPDDRVEGGGQGQSQGQGHAQAQAHGQAQAQAQAHGHGHGHEHEHGNKRGRAGHTLNLRGAWLHLLGDTLGSLAALVAALIMRFGGPTSVDPIASFLVAAILVYGAVKLIRDATLVLLESAPRHLPVFAVRQVILDVAGVLDVHDMHVWTLGAGHDAITVHVRSSTHDRSLAQRVSRRLREEFDAEYVTVQVELTDDCGAPPSLFKPTSD